jgi:hypothetical protein
MASLEQTVQQSVLKVAQTVEQQLDAELERLEKLDSDDLDRLREQRLKDMKKQAQQQQEWRVLVRYLGTTYCCFSYKYLLFCVVSLLAEAWALRPYSSIFFVSFLGHFIEFLTNIAKCEN